MPPADQVVVGNPRARMVKGAWRTEVERGFGLSARLQFLASTGRAELERIAGQVAAARDRLLVVAGGDGSVNWVVNALEGAPIILGLLPLGTANDLARGLALPSRLADAIARIRSGRRRRCDLLSVNGRRFCTVGGIGVAADSALFAQALRDNGHRPLRWALRRSGPHAYWLVAGARVLQAAPANHFDLRVRLAGGASERSFSFDAHAIFVANQTTVGGRLRISPGSRNDDGVFELCILPAGSRGAVLATLGRLVLGMSVADSALEVIPATWARITCRRPTRFFGDGEGLGTETDTFEIGVQPGALEVVGA
jgi:diacylglycerol kinase (ATP)